MQKIRKLIELQKVENHQEEKSDLFSFSGHS